MAEACYTRGKVNSIEIAAAVLDAVEKGDDALKTWKVYANGMTIGEKELKDPKKDETFDFGSRKMVIIYVDVDSQTVVCDYV